MMNTERDTHLPAEITVEMSVLIMINQPLARAKVLATFLTVMVTLTLHPMLYQPDLRLEVFVAVVTDVMPWRVRDVLVQVGVTPKRSVAPFTVEHFRPW